MDFANTIKVTRSDNMVCLEFAFSAVDPETDSLEAWEHVATIEIPEATAGELDGQLTRLLTSAE